MSLSGTVGGVKAGAEGVEEGEGLVEAEGVKLGVEEEGGAEGDESLLAWSLWRCGVFIHLESSALMNRVSVKLVTAICTWA